MEDKKPKKTIDLLLAIDSGTQNVKVAVYDTKGREIALSRHPFDADSAPHPRWLEHDPDDYLKKMLGAIREVIEAIGKDAKRLKAVGVTSQRGTVIPIDGDGKTLRPAIVYQDGRTTTGLPKLGGFWGLFFKLTGMSSAIEYVRSHSRYAWIRKNEPEIYDRTYKFLHVASLITYYLTGNISESMGNMVGMLPIDYKKLDFYPQKGIHDIFGVTPRLLPEIKRSGSLMGHITDEASGKTGIPPGLPVFVGGGDVQSAALGMGVVTDDYAALTLGTSISLVIPSNRYISEKAMRFLPWPSAVPDEYILETGLPGGFITVTWFKNEIAHFEARLSENSEKSTEELLDDAVRDIPPGSLGLMVHPYFTAPVHKDHARGSIIGLTIAHRRAHLYRAILEGIAFETREGYETMVGKMGKGDVKEIRVTGGASKSDTVLKITADVFGIPTVKMEVEESAALGAAISAACGVGLFDSLGDAIGEMVRVKKRFDPDPKNRETYESIYKSFKEFYPRVADIYRETARFSTLMM